MKTTLLLCLALTACGDSSPPDRLSGAVLGKYRLYCERLFACESEYSSAAHSGRSLREVAGGVDADACFAAIRSTILQNGGMDYLSSLDESVTAGRIRYSPADYQTCSDLFARQSCDQLYEQNGQSYVEPTVCRTVKVGLVAPDGKCTIDDDCGFGFCDEVCSQPGPAVLQS